MSEADLQVRPADAVALQAAFRDAMRALAGGVALISTVHEGVRHGLTVTAVNSLTMDPPALVVSVNRTASAYAPLAASGRFCVNLLADSHAALATAFSRKPDGDARFANGAWRAGESGLPTLDGSVAAIACRLHDRVEFGTHAILIGAVEGFEVAPQPLAPLVYLNRQFGAFRPFPA